MARKTTTRNFTAIAPNRVFVDTSGWYAVASADDRCHRAAATHYAALVQSGAALVTSDYVLDETLTRLRYDFGHAVALAFWNQLAAARDSGLLTLLRVDAETWDAALAIFARYTDQPFSFTDCASFALCQREAIAEVFAFDHHFRLFGLLTLPVP